MIASYQGSADLVKCLLSSGADVNKADKVRFYCRVGENIGQCCLFGGIEDLPVAFLNFTA